MIVDNAIFKQITNERINYDEYKKVHTRRLVLSIIYEEDIIYDKAYNVRLVD